MGQRLLIIGGAIVLAVAVLLVTFLSDTPQLTTPGSTGAAENTPAPAPPTPGITPRDLVRAPARPETGPIATGQYQVERLDRGRLWQFWGQRVTPLPQGLMRVELPGMRMHMEPWRVLQITAARGVFVAPNNQPRSGDFEGDVVVTLFESPDNSRPDLDDDSPHTQLRLYLDEAAFDVELGQIDSNSPVHLTGPAVDFVGKGLRVNYNERRNRIERLEVATGEALRIKPRVARERPEREPVEPPAVVLPPAQPSRAQDDPPTPRQQRQREREERRREQAAATEPEPPRGPQYYRATFEKNVRIVSASGTIDADTMQVLFSFDEDEQSPATSDAAAAPAAPSAHTRPSRAIDPPRTAGFNIVTVAQVDAAPASPALPQTKNPTLAVVAADDVVITWTGKLIVSPEETAPDGLAGPEDRMVILHGSPVRIITPRGDTATAASVTYTEQSQRVAMAASDEHPLIVQSSELGELRGSSLSIDQSQGTGYVIGPGELIAQAQVEAPDAEATQPMRIAWTDRLDLTFYLRDRADGDEQTTAVRAVRTADFRGDVKATHPQFDLTAQRLAAALTPPAAVNRSSRQSIQRLDASGDVHVDARGDAPQDAMAIDAQTLVIDLAPTPDGRSVPTAMQARERVKIVRPQQTLWANRLDVGLGADEGGKVAVRTLRAEDDVRVDVQPEDSGGFAALAHLLVADAVKGEAELFGNATSMARVMREDGELHGQRIVMYENSRQAHVPGPGSLTFVTGRDASDPDAQPTHLNVAWTQAMRYDDAAGLAVFVGDVAAATSSARDRTKLTSRELHLEFEPRDQAQGMATLLGGDRAIRKLTATGSDAQPRADAVFLAMSYDGPPDDPATHMDTRLRLAGPSIVFTNPDERVAVHGKGSMLVEDYRGLHRGPVASAPVSTNLDPTPTAADTPPPSPPKAPPVPSGLRPPKPAAEKPARDQPVFITGKGQTLFTWTGSLQLDARNNDLLIKDDVMMLHKTPQSPSVVQINCDTLAADQETSEGGGMSVWLAGDAPKPQVQTVKADGNVRIREGTTTIFADHAHYDGTSGGVDIFGDGRRLVTVQDEDEPLGQLTARRLRWRLADNRFEVIGPGPGRAPMGIQRRVESTRK